MHVVSKKYPPQLNVCVMIHATMCSPQRSNRQIVCGDGSVHSMATNVIWSKSVNKPLQWNIDKISLLMLNLTSLSQSGVGVLGFLQLPSLSWTEVSVASLMTCNADRGIALGASMLTQAWVVGGEQTCMSVYIKLMFLLLNLFLFLGFLKLRLDCAFCRNDRTSWSKLPGGCHRWVYKS